MEIKLHQPEAEIFIPNGMPAHQALARTTHMAIGAHLDDIEIMAAKPILECVHDENLQFSGVVMTDGRSSVRDHFYQDFTDEEMRQVRFKEQKKAAHVGEYTAQILLDYPSKAIKDPANQNVINDLTQILIIAEPDYIYTHNLADKHDTHVSTSLRVVTAIRSLPVDKRPKKLYGCEVWRSLDWLADQDKVPFDLTEFENLQLALLGVYDSQISGGKRYDLATMGRRLANATFFESHGLDTAQRLSFAMDLTPLIKDDTKDIHEYILGFISQFYDDVRTRFEKFM